MVENKLFHQNNKNEMDTKSVNNVSDIAFCVAEESSPLFPENVTAMLVGVEQSVLV